MDFIKTTADLDKNLLTFTKGLMAHDESFRALLQRGVCFVAYESEGLLRFAPSRFLGYLSNTPSRHSSNSGKDGRLTNPAINDVLRPQQPVEDAALESAYIAYYHHLGVTPRLKGTFGVTRKFWRR